MSAPFIALYADGGVAGRNPSPIGGSYAWCAVDEHGVRVIEQSGVVLPPLSGGPVTNNQTEFIAAVLALEAAPAGWDGLFYSDSEVTIGRIFYNWKLTNISQAWVARMMKARSTLGLYAKAVLLDGHPTRAELEFGIGKRGHPVSEHNVWCDKACGERVRELLKGGGNS